MRKILLLVLVLVSFSAIGQVVQFPTNYGVGYRRTGADTLLWIPTDTFAVPAPLASRTHVARKASNLYYWNGNKWAVLSGGGSTDTTSLSNRINLKLNISDTSSMLTNYINGVGYALLKTGQTVRADSATLASYFLRRKDSVAGGYYPYSSNPKSYLVAADLGGYVATSRTISTTYPIQGGGDLSANRTFSLDTVSGKWRSEGYYDTKYLTSIPTWQQTLTAGSTLTGANTIAGGAYNFTFGNMGLFTISQTAKASVSGSNGTAHVSPLTITGGNGGATSYSTGTVSGGNAGNVSVTAGNGGAITGTPTTGIGGTGGYIDLVAGDGGLGTTFGGTAGFVNIQGGTSGGGTSAGSAGYVSIKGGMAASTGNGDGGNIYLSPGAKNGSGLDGHIFLGVSPSTTVRGSATIGSATRGDSLFNIKSGGLYADRGVRFPNTPSFADTSNYKPVVMNSSGTLYKATYWPGGGGGTPGGSTKQIQYNNAGAFAGASGFEYGNTNNLVSITSPATGNVPLLVKAGGTQTARLTEWKNAAGTLSTAIDSSGRLVTYLNGGYDNIIGTYQNSARADIYMKFYTGYDIGFHANATSAYITTSSPKLQLNLPVEISASGTYPLTVIGAGGSVPLRIGQYGSIEINSSNYTGYTQIRGQTNNNLFYADATNDKVGIGTASPNSIFQVNGSFSTAYVSKAVDYTATASDCIIEVTATGKTITLPTAASITGRQYTIKLTASGSGTVGTTSSQTIDGSTTYSLSAQYKYVTVVSNGSNWIVIANN